MPKTKARPNLLPVPDVHKAHRILFLQNSSIFDSYGGVQYYLDDLLSAAAETYGERSVYTLVPAPHESFTAPKMKYQVELVPVSKSKIVRKLENRFSPAFYRSAMDVIDHLNPSLIVCGHVSLAPLGYALNRATKIPYLTIAYGTDAWGNLWPQDEWSFKRSAGIISISQWTKKVLVDRGYSPHKIKIITPRVAPKFEKNKWFTRRPKKTFTLLTVSRLSAAEQYKGQDHVLKALHQIKKSKTKSAPNIRYIIQGDGDDRSRLEALTKTLELQDLVEFRSGVTNRNELAKSFKEADAFIMPSRFGRWKGAWRGEGFGIVYAEAAMFGLPSIAYNYGGATDIIQHGETGFLVEPENIKALAESITKLAKAPKLTREMGKQALEYVQSHFTGKPVTEQMLQVFDLF